MKKCVYDISSGKVLAYANEQQNINSIMDNYTNCDYIEINELPLRKEFGHWHVDLETKQHIKIT